MRNATFNRYCQLVMSFMLPNNLFVYFMVNLAERLYETEMNKHCKKNAIYFPTKNFKPLDHCQWCTSFWELIWSFRTIMLVINLFFLIALIENAIYAISTITISQKYGVSEFLFNILKKRTDIDSVPLNRWMFNQPIKYEISQKCKVNLH